MMHAFRALGAEMPVRLTLRRAGLDDLSEMTALVLRSKAYWGYSREFLAASLPYLRITAEDVLYSSMAVAADPDDRILGVYSLICAGREAELNRLYVDPDVIGHGIGSLLFCNAALQAREFGASRLVIEADPNAETFYRRMGAIRIGIAPSKALPDRVLPLLELPLLERPLYDIRHRSAAP